MKILIQNYSSPLSTEPLYLNECLNQSGGCATSFLWDSQSTSVFDALDKTSPDVCVVHGAYRKLEDVLKYLSGNKTIQLILNITGINDTHLTTLESTLSAIDIKCPFFINNNFPEIAPIIEQKTKIVNLFPAHDPFLPKSRNVSYEIGAAIISSNPDGINDNAIAKRHKTYHKIMLVKQQQDIGNPNYDLHLGLAALPQFYGLYDEVAIVDNAQTVFSQVFFDAVIYSKRVSFSGVGDSMAEDMLNRLFPGQETEGDSIRNIVTRGVKENHTCYNRAIEFANALQASNLSASLSATRSRVFMEKQ